MAKFTCVWFETNRVELEVEAETPEAAIAIADARVDKEGWEICEETSVGTGGIEDVLDADGVSVWRD